MRRALLLALLATLAAGQDEGGRDTGTGPRPVLFVRARRTLESGEIFHAAWRALEPHFGILSRRRLVDFDGDPKKAAACFEANRDARLIVAMGPEVLPFLPEGIAVIRVAEEEAAHLSARTDRSRLAQAIRLFRPGTKRIALFGGSPEEALAGMTLVPCNKPEEARGCDLAWIPEGSGEAAELLRRALDREGIPLVATRGDLDAGVAALTVRPDAGSLGLKLAAQLLRWARESAAFESARVERHRITIDLGAARAAGFEVPLEALARADVVRRAP